MTDRIGWEVGLLLVGLAVGAGALALVALFVVGLQPGAAPSVSFQTLPPVNIDSRRAIVSVVVSLILTAIAVHLIRSTDWNVDPPQSTDTEVG
jgi:hypothetical protein